MIKADREYMTKLRREIHMYPEVDYDLPKTVALVKRELDALDIPYTEKYGKGSVVGYINPEKEGFTIGIRADMDALRITEENDAPYRSKHNGMMHACGHDAHTAILLGTAKALKEMESTLDCRVKLIFQPSEEGVTSGAMMMIDNGVMDDVDVVAGLHVSADLNVGEVSYCPEISFASSRHFKIEIFGKNAHATTYHRGIDALSIAFRMYSGIQSVAALEVSPFDEFVCIVTKLEAGVSQNIVPNYALMQGTIRTFDMPLSEFLYERILKIADSLSAEYGVEIKVHAPLKSVCLYNNPYVTQLIKESMVKTVGEENVKLGKRVLGSEDFSRYTELVPATFFRLGVKNAEKGIISSLHQAKFDVDEDALEIGCKTFLQFVVDNQKGIDLEKCKGEK